MNAHQNVDNKLSLEDLASTIIAESAGASIALQAKILNLLAEGHPVSSDELSASLGIPQREVKSNLTRLGGEFDENGNLVGLGLTLKATPHKFRVNGHELYAWCATDTLWFPMLLNKTASVETVDPVNGEKIRLSIAPKGIEKVEPRGAVVSFTYKNLNPEDIRGSFCNFSHWFSSNETASTYASTHPGVVILTADDVREVGRIVFERTQLG